MKKKLSEKQLLFCQEYVVDLNATQAYIRAGYKNKSVKSTEASSSRLLSNDKVQAQIRELQLIKQKNTGITAEMVIAELALLAFSDPAKLFNEHGHLIPIQELPEEVSRTISEVTTTIKLVGKGDDAEPYEVTKIKQHDKKGSLDLLGRHFGIYEKDNTLDINGTVQYIIKRSEKKERPKNPTEGGLPREPSTK